MQLEVLYLTNCQLLLFLFIFFNATATTEIYTLSLHDALPICSGGRRDALQEVPEGEAEPGDHHRPGLHAAHPIDPLLQRSEEHTSELQSRRDLVCRLLLEKKKKKTINNNTIQTKTHTTSTHHT